MMINNKQLFHKEASTDTIYKKAYCKNPRLIIQVGHAFNGRLLPFT